MLLIIVIKFLIVSSVMSEIITICKLENAHCYDNTECCSNLCQPLGLGSIRNTCKAVIDNCAEIGTICENSEECCTKFCRPNSSPNFSGLCDARPRSPLMSKVRF